MLRLIVYALVGYAVYHFFTDVVNNVQSAQLQGGGGGRGGRGRSGGGGGNRGGGSRARSGGAAARMTGRAKAGQVEETQDNDGGSVRHRVGRGVV